MALRAIDISTWQSGIDFNAVKRSGITAVLIRAGFGREVSQKDSQFENHYKGAKAAGLKVGVYWYSYADSIADAAKEAKACLACLDGRGLDLPVYYDMEESSQTAYGRSTLTTMAKTFCDTIIGGGYKAGIYANWNWFTNYLDYTFLKSHYSIWLAQWSSSNSLACDIWQYSDKGTVSGIAGSVDMNYILNESVLDGSDSNVVTCEITFRYLAKDGYTRTGGEVKTLQRLLNSLGYKGANGKALDVDGIFGDNTDYAVKAFQKAMGLVADGIVGPATYTKLFEI